MTVVLRFVRTTARGRVLGESNGACRHSDAVVEQARQMRASGMYYRAISAATGAALSTVHRWLHGARPPPARTIVKRAKTPIGGSSPTANFLQGTPRNAGTPNGDSNQDS